MAVDKEALNAQLANIEKQKSKIVKRFIEVHPTTSHVVENLGGGSYKIDSPSHAGDLKKYDDFQYEAAEYERLSQMANKIREILDKAELLENAQKKVQQEEDLKDIKLLRKTFPGIDISDYYYILSSDGKSSTKTMKSLEQLQVEKENLYQKVSQFQGTIHERQALLQSIDKVYDEFMAKANSLQSENKPTL